MTERGHSRSPSKQLNNNNNNNSIGSGGEQHHQQDAPTANLPPPVDDLHRLFPDIPANERAIRNFPCSHLVRKFMCVGRLYLTPTRLCFVGLLSANVSFEWRNITSLEKRSSLLFDSIEMKVKTTAINNKTGKEELLDVTFTGFVNGSDEPYQIMKTLWNVKKNFSGNNNNNGVKPSLSASASTNNIMNLENSSSSSPANNNNNPASSSNLNKNVNLIVATTSPENNANNNGNLLSTPENSGAQQNSSRRASGSAAGVDVVASATTPRNTDEEIHQKNVPTSPNPKLPNTQNVIFGGGGATSSSSPATSHQDPNNNNNNILVNDNDSFDRKHERSQNEESPDMSRNHHCTHAFNEDYDDDDSGEFPKNSHLAATQVLDSPRSPPMIAVSSASTTNTTGTAEGNATSTSNLESGKVASTASPSSRPVSPQRAPFLANNNNNNNTTTTSTSSRPVSPASTTGGSKQGSNKVSPSLNPNDGLTLVTPQVQLDPSQQQKQQSQQQQQQYTNNQSFGSSPLSPQTLAAATTTTKFPGVPKTERVLDSFQCSYIQGVHRYGRLAVTQNYLLFSSMVCSPFSVKLADVETVTKQTNLVILEGFAVQMKDGATKHEFTSFAGTRDKAFGLICDLVRSQAQVNAALGIGSKPSQATLELNKKESSPPAAHSTSSPTTKKEHDGSSSSESDENDDDDARSTTTTNTAAPEDTNNSNGEKKAASSSSFATKRISPDPSTWYDSFTDYETFDKMVGHSYGDTAFSPPSKLMEFTLLADMDCIKGASMSDVFRTVFDDNVPFAFEYRRLRTPIPDTDTVVEPWQAPTSSVNGKQLPPGDVSAGIRIMTCKTTIKALTAVICPYTEYQRFLVCKKKDTGNPMLMVQFSGQASGAMFSESFRAETLMVFQPHPQSTPQSPQMRCQIYFYINYISTPFMIKGKVKSAATAECIESYRNFFDVANRFLTADLASASASAGKTSKKGSTKGSKKKHSSSSSSSSSPTTAAVPPPTAVAHQPQGVVATQLGVAPKPELNPMIDNTRKVFLVLAFLYALRCQFSMWWSQPEDPSTQGNYVAFNHLAIALSNLIIAYVIGEVGPMIPM